MTRPLHQSVFQSAAWAQIARHLTEKREALRALNDDVSLSEVETAALRGEIRFATYLLDLASPPAPDLMNPDPDLYPT